MGASGWDASVVRQLAGRLEVRLTGTVLRFCGDPPRRDRIELPADGGVIGRHPLAAARLPADAAAVSRKHLAFAPLGVGWHAWDCGSAHGTTVALPDGSRRRLIAWVPVPVRDQQRYELASAVTLVIRIRFTDNAGTVTAGAETVTLITDVELETAARALVAPRRDDLTQVQIPSVAELSAALGCSPGTVYNRLRELWALPAIVALLGPIRDQRLDRQALADALARSYPYLLLDPPPMA